MAAEARAEELLLVAEFQAKRLSEIDVQMMGAWLRRSLLDGVPSADRELLANALAPVNFMILALSVLGDNIFARTIDAIDEQFEAQPLIRARLLFAVADTLGTLDLSRIALAPQRRALDVRRNLLGETHADTLTSINNMGAVLHHRGLLTEAESESESRRRLLIGVCRAALSSGSA